MRANGINETQLSKYCHKLQWPHYRHMQLLSTSLGAVCWQCRHQDKCVDAEWHYECVDSESSLEEEDEG